MTKLWTILRLFGIANSTVDRRKNKKW